MLAGSRDLRDILRSYIPDSAIWEESVCGTLLYAPWWAASCSGLAPDDFHYAHYRLAFRDMLRAALRDPIRVTVAEAARKVLRDMTNPADRAVGQHPCSIVEELDAWVYRQCEDEATLRWVCGYVHELSVRRRCWQVGVRVLDMATCATPEAIEAMLRRVGDA